MKTLYLIKNKGQEVCSDLVERDTQQIEHEKRQAQKDSKRFQQIIRETRIRLGLEVAI